VTPAPAAARHGRRGGNSARDRTATGPEMHGTYSPRKSPAMRGFPSAPNRIRTCDHRFRSALFAGISGLTKPGSVELEGPREGQICRLGDRVRDNSRPRIRTKGSLHRPRGEWCFACGYKQAERRCFLVIGCGSATGRDHTPALLVARPGRALSWRDSRRSFPRASGTWPRPFGWHRRWSIGQPALDRLPRAVALGTGRDEAELPTIERRIDGSRGPAAACERVTGDRCPAGVG
jgi:hypothetical protein